MGSEEEISLVQRVGFEFRYKLKIHEGPANSREEKTMEVQGAGYRDLDEALKAAESCRDKVRELLEAEPIPRMEA